jgi:putative transposase
MTTKNYNFRIYPKEKHKKKLFNAFDTCKDVWNHLLETRIETWEKDKIYLNNYNCHKLISRKNGKEEWKKVYNHILQNQSKRLDDSFKAFFRRCKTKQKQKGYPQFKKRLYSITYPDKYKVGYEIIGNRLWVSKIGLIPIRLHREIDGTIKNLTIKRLRTGEWYAIFSVQKEENKIEKIDISKPIGIDMGLKTFAFLSDGTQYLHPKHLQQSEKRLKLFQRRVSRKVKGSNNRRKARYKLARFYQHIANQRKDFLHKVSIEIGKKYSFIALETLNILGMVKNHHLAKSINSSGWNNFQRMLEYKGNVVYIKPFTPSTCICSNCGIRNEMKLSDRIFNCSNCGLTIDRDYNASKVILQSALNQNGYSNYIQLNDTVGYTEIKTSEEFSPLSFYVKHKKESRNVESEIEKDKKLSSSKKSNGK